MLREYVDDGGIDYASWQVKSANELQRWLAKVQSINLEGIGRDSAIAFLLNLYNALTVQQVLLKYPIKSICPRVLGIPNWLSFLQFFQKKIYTLDGRPLSLNGIEHGILRRNYSEPRIHFALVCASKGCPLLRSGAYQPELLPMQLEEDAYRFINNPAKVRYDAHHRTLYCSKIFKWYRSDFLSQTASIADYIQTFLPSTDLPTGIDVTFLPYDWSLNQRTSS